MTGAQKYQEHEIEIYIDMQAEEDSVTLEYIREVVQAMKDCPITTSVDIVKFMHKLDNSFVRRNREKLNEIYPMIDVEEYAECFEVIADFFHKYREIL